MFDDPTVDEAGDIEHGQFHRSPRRGPEERPGGGATSLNPDPDGVAGLDRAAWFSAPLLAVRRSTLRGLRFRGEYLADLSLIHI